MSYSTSFYLDNIIYYHKTSYEVVYQRRSVSNPVYVVNPGYYAPARQTRVNVNNVEMMREMRRNDEEDRNRERDNSAALIGGIATVVFAALYALGGRHYSNTKKELSNALMFRDMLPGLQLENGVQRDLTRINNQHIDILSEKVDFAKNVGKMTGGALVCSAAGFLGGMFSIPGLITTSVIGIVGISAMGAFSAVWYLTGDHHLPQHMLNRVEQIRTTMA